MSEEIIVQNDKRKQRRDIEKVLSNDLRKILAEIVTNSDDSYKRLNLEDQDNNLESKKINIVVDKSKRVVTIIDNAEGMNANDVQKNFESYGADKSGRSSGHKVRGLFGQGASDVLFFSASHHLHSEIKSIKDKKFYSAKFIYEDSKRKIKLTEGVSRVRDIRNAYNIPEPKNGTVVLFGLPKKVSFPNDVVNKVRTFYMTRFIYSSSNREVILKLKNGKGNITRLVYDFPNVDEDSKIIEQEIEFRFENQVVIGKFKLFKIACKDEEEYGQLKILVYDNEQNVYDNTFFDFTDKHPGAENIFGYLELIDTASIIRDKLNQEHPEEILTETREGLTKTHEFYKALNRVIEPLLKKAFVLVNKEDSEKVISFDKSKEWNNAFKEINKYFKESLGEDIGGETGDNAPSEGMRFVRPAINITLDKTYTVNLLINTDIVPIGTEIKLQTDSLEAIEYFPQELILTHKDIKNDNLATKSISVKGLSITKESIAFSASTDGGKEAKLFINVIANDIHYPKYGLEFYPQRLIVKPNKIAKAHLFFDTSKFLINSIVQLKSSNPEISLINQQLVLGEDNLITDTIGVIDCEFIGKNKDIDGNIIAVCKNFETSVEIMIRENYVPPIGSGNFISGMDIKKSDQFWQSFFHKSTRKIIINSGNNINIVNLGRIESLDSKSLSFQQKNYISELCSNEGAKQLVFVKIEKGKLPDGDIESYLDEMQKDKNNMMSIFSKTLFTG